MSETTRTDGPRFCRSCGAQADPEAAFCRSCGARLQSAQPQSPVPQVEPQTETQPQIETQPQPAIVDRVSESIREQAGKLPSRVPEPARRYLVALSSRLAGGAGEGPRRDVSLGAALGAGGAVGLLAVVYAVLVLRGTFGSPFVPKDVGLTIFALLHGGSAEVEMPPMPLLLNVSGWMGVDLPVTSFAVVPFAAAFLAGRGVAKRARVSWGFAVGAAVSYALMVAAFAALGATFVGTDQFVVSLRVAPLPVAAWGALLVGSGAAVGVATVSGYPSAARLRSAARGANLLGPRLKTHLVQACQGALLAAAVGFLPIAVLSALDIAACGYGTLLGQGCEGRGVLLALFPTVAGGMWLLGHGLPFGFQSGTEGLSSVPLVGEYFATVPSSLSLLGSWPLGDGWRLLVVVPALSVLLGGMVSARGVHARDRFFQGALVCVPYVAIAVLVNALVAMTASASVAGFGLEIALRVALPWMLVLLVVTALVGGLGGLLATPERIEALRSRLPSRLLRYLHRPEKRVA